MAPWLTLAIAAALTASAPSLSGRILTSGGLGDVRIGMTLSQAEQALDTKLSLDSTQNPKGVCTYATRADGRDPNVRFMMLNGAIQRIDVELRSGSSIRTRSGAGFGASETAVRRAYGEKAAPDQNDYAGATHDLIVKDASGSSGVRFGFQDGRLRWLLAGRYPALGFSEGCL